MHGLLSAVPFMIAKSKILLITCLPTQNMEYLMEYLMLGTWNIWYLYHRLPYPFVLSVTSQTAAARKKGCRKVYTNEGNTIGTACGVYFLHLLSQLEHLLWSVLSLSHPHKHCLTLVESVPLCWLSMSLCYRHSLDNFIFFFLWLFFNSHFAMCSIVQHHWMILPFQ